MKTALQRIPLVCPLDDLPLSERDNSLVCADGHCHDLARQGYVNLLPVQFKSSKHPGDSDAMVAARRRVMDAGVFEPVADAVAESVLVCAATVVDSAPLLVDAGCGEGYYTHRFEQELERVQGAERFGVIGTDISKPAIVAAARRYISNAWAVANNTRLPVVPGRIGIITSLFGFETWQPWAERQTAGQWVIVVDAGPRHLIEMRQAIYSDVHLHEPPDDAAAIAAGYERHATRDLTVAARRLSNELTLDLLAMTPHAHRVGWHATEAIRSVASLDVTLDIAIRTYRRRQGAST